jgi:hypothetical protein
MARRKNEAAAPSKPEAAAVVDVPSPLPRSVDLTSDELPPEIARLLEINGMIREIQPETVTHYVYRHVGDQSSSPKEAMGVITDIREVPTAHDLGERFRRGGVYQVVSVIVYLDANGDRRKVTKAAPVMRVSSYYETGGAAASAPASAAAPSVTAPDSMSQMLGFMEKFAEIAVKLRGEAQPPDVEFLQKSMRDMQRDFETRLQREREEADERIRRARAERPKEDETISPKRLEEWAETAGTAAKAFKGAVDLFASGDK